MLPVFVRLPVNKLVFSTKLSMSYLVKANSSTKIASRNYSDIHPFRLLLGWHWALPFPVWRLQPISCNAFPPPTRRVWWGLLVALLPNALVYPISCRQGLGKRTSRRGYGYRGCTHPHAHEISKTRQRFLYPDLRSFHHYL